MLPTFELLRPQTLEEALELLAETPTACYARESDVRKGGNDASSV